MLRGISLGLLMFLALAVGQAVAGPLVSPSALMARLSGGQARSGALGARVQAA